MLDFFRALCVTTYTAGHGRCAPSVNRLFVSFHTSCVFSLRTDRNHLRHFNFAFIENVALLTSRLTSPVTCMTHVGAVADYHAFVAGAIFPFPRFISRRYLLLTPCRLINTKTGEDVDQSHSYTFDVGIAESACELCAAETRGLSFLVVPEKHCRMPRTALV